MEYIYAHLATAFMDNVYKETTQEFQDSPGGDHNAQGPF